MVQEGEEGTVARPKNSPIAKESVGRSVALRLRSFLRGDGKEGSNEMEKGRKENRYRDFAIGVRSLPPT